MIRQTTITQVRLIHCTLTSAVMLTTMCSVCTLNPATMERLGLFRGDTVLVRFVSMYLYALEYNLNHLG